MEHPKFSDLNKCILNKRLDNTTGFAEEARQNERLCGLYGRWHTHWPADQNYVEKASTNVSFKNAPFALGKAFGVHDDFSVRVERGVPR